MPLLLLLELLLCPCLSPGCQPGCGRGSRGAALAPALVLGQAQPRARASKGKRAEKEEMKG